MLCVVIVFGLFTPNLRSLQSCRRQPGKLLPSSRARRDYGGKIIVGVNPYPRFDTGGCLLGFV